MGYAAHKTNYLNGVKCVRIVRSERAQQVNMVRFTASRPCAAACRINASKTRGAIETSFASTSLARTRNKYTQFQMVIQIHNCT